ncbi:MAG: 1-deoxy-D-xylulose-5-phosphate synthase N-terminal domain-containing protein, partial [Bifidobacterium pseudocatenulatum]
MTAGILSSIHTPADVHALSAQQLRDLCLEIRATLLDYGKKHGGHIGSNLGVVELTVALHRVFDSPRDRFIFDVSHQSYVHKMLTGRAEAYLDQSRFDEVTGFT